MTHLYSVIGFSMFFFACGVLPAQITISGDQFPKSGDTLVVATDNLPGEVSVPPAGTNQEWMLGNLQAPFASRVLFLDAAEGEGFESFPGADLVAKIAEGVEGYYREEDGEFIFLGTFGRDPLELGVDLAVDFGAGLVERKAPLRYGDTYESSSSAEVPFSADDLPQEVLDQLPIVPDSLKVLIVTERKVVVDGWGTMHIPGGSYEVLREKRTETRTVNLEAKIGFLPWFDITGMLPENDFLGDLNSVSYHFISDVEKEAIAEFFLNSDESELQRVLYKGDDFVTNVRDVAGSKPGVYAYPNPAIVNVRFEFTNLPPGDYDVKIYDILAAEVWSQRYYISGAKTIKADISNLRKGTYLYSLVDSSGKTLVTRRLVVLRP